LLRCAIGAQHRGNFEFLTYNSYFSFRNGPAFAPINQRVHFALHNFGGENNKAQMRGQF